MRFSTMPVERLKELLSYDPETGAFTWRVNTGHTMAGDPAGGFDHEGYWKIKVDGRMFFASRLAWALMTGAFPTTHIDHANRDRSDNRWSNLRQDTRKQNNHNTTLRRDNQTGLKGVRFDPRNGRYYARTRVDGREKHLGTFVCPNEAHAAYLTAAESFFGDFATAGHHVVRS